MTPNGAFCRRMYPKAKALFSIRLKQAAMREKTQNSGEAPMTPKDGGDHGKTCQMCFFLQLFLSSDT